jgi:hypothetical protein
MAEEVTAEQELKNALWVWTQRTVVALVLFGGGILAAYLRGATQPISVSTTKSFKIRSSI